MLKNWITTRTMIVKSVSVWKNESALLYTRETFTPSFLKYSIIHYIIILLLLILCFLWVPTKVYLHYIPTKQQD